MWFSELPKSINNWAAQLFILVYTQKLLLFPEILAIVYIDLLFSVGSISVAFVQKHCYSSAFGCLPTKGLQVFWEPNIWVDSEFFGKFILCSAIGVCFKGKVHLIQTFYFIPGFSLVSD